MKKLYRIPNQEKLSYIGLDLSEVVAFWLVDREEERDYPSKHIRHIGHDLVLLIRQPLGSKPIESKFLYSSNAGTIYDYNKKENVDYPESFHVGKEIYDDLVKYWQNGEINVVS